MSKPYVQHLFELKAIFISKLAQHSVTQYIGIMAPKASAAKAAAGDIIYKGGKGDTKGKPSMIQMQGGQAQWMQRNYLDHHPDIIEDLMRIMSFEGLSSPNNWIKTFHRASS